MRHLLLTLLLLGSCTNLLSDKEPDTPAVNVGPSSSFVLKDPPASYPAAPALRLPTEATPLRYRVALSLDPSKKTFTGDIEIDLKITKPLSVLWLNATKLKITAASLWVGGPKPRAVAYETPQGKQGSYFATPIPGDDHFIGLDFTRPLPTGVATLYLSYQGEFNEGLRGIFVQEDNKERYLYTQFESTYARRAFPCFDEPSFKTPWQLTITAPSQLEVFSNTPQQTETFQRDQQLLPYAEADTKTVSFAQTKPLPSYLIAFAVGPFEVVDGGKIGKNKIQHRVIALKNQGAWSREAIDATPAILAALEDYLGSPYPYEKLDQIAVPSFFGAMENPGLITYSKSLLLAEPGKENLRQKRSFAQVGAHELAHQWFGNLVTLAWWDELWLNESFAEWMSRRVIAELHPDWFLAESSVNSANGAKRQDRAADAISIRQPILVHRDIGRSFGNVYSKGQAMLFMLERALGAQVFQQGVQRYLKENAMKNATSQEFFASMNQEAGRDVSQEFYSFTNNPGVPVVSAKLTCDKASAPKLTLSQSRYQTWSQEKKTAPLWKIPVCIRYKALTEERRECLTLQDASTTQNLSTKACPDWLVLNDNASGYYYSGYSKELLQKLFKDGGKQLSTAERLSIMADLDAQISSGELPPGEALLYAVSLLQDPNHNLTRESSNLMQRLLGQAPKELAANKERALQAIYGPRLKGVTFAAPSAETDDQRLARRTSLQHLSSLYRNEALLTEATTLVKQWLSGDTSGLETELQSAAFTIATKYGDKALFEAILDKAKTAKPQSNEMWLLYASLGGFADPALTQRALTLLLEKEFPSQYSGSILFEIAQTQPTPELLLGFIDKHYEALMASISAPKTKDYAQQMPGLFGRVCDAEYKKKVEEILAPRLKGDADAEKELARTVKIIDECITTKAKHADSLKTFLLKY